MTVAVTIDADRITAIRFNGDTCSIGRASASMMTDLVTGLTRDEVATLKAQVAAVVQGDPDAARAAPGDLQALAEIRRTPARAACALLPWDALAEALTDALTHAPG